jgi:glycosyltransferase involved in cell wall biosynthesis
VKVLHVIDSLDLGGAQKVVQALFERRSHDRSIFLYSLRPAHADSFRISHQNVFLTKHASRYSHYPLYDLRDFIRANNITILHCHLMKSQIIGVLLKSLYFPSIKLVFHEHGAIISSTDDANRFIDTVFKQFLKYSKSKVDGYVAVSSAIRETIIRTLGVEESRVALVYNFSNTRMNRAHGLRDMSGLSERGSEMPRKFVVGFAGRLTRRKGLWEFLQAAESLSGSGQFEFRIAGDGPDRKKMIAWIAKKRLGGTVEYLNYVPNMEMFYSNIDCLAVPSHWEPFGLVVLEAQLARIPVVASDVPGIQELVQNGENGLLFAPGSAPALAEAITTLQREAVLRRRIIEKAALSASRFNREDAHIEIDHFYHRRWPDLAKNQSKIVAK